MKISIRNCKNISLFVSEKFLYYILSTHPCICIFESIEIVRPYTDTCICIFEFKEIFRPYTDTCICTFESIEIVRPYSDTCICIFEFKEIFRPYTDTCICIFEFKEIVRPYRYMHLYNWMFRNYPTQTYRITSMYLCIGISNRSGSNLVGAVELTAQDLINGTANMQMCSSKPFIQARQCIQIYAYIMYVYRASRLKFRSSFLSASINCYSVK